VNLSPDKTSHNVKERKCTKQPKDIEHLSYSSSKDAQGLKIKGMKVLKIFTQKNFEGGPWFLNKIQRRYLLYGLSFWITFFFENSCKGSFVIPPPRFHCASMFRIYHNIYLFELSHMSQVKKTPPKSKTQKTKQ
jgi:hypothetical protein